MSTESPRTQLHSLLTAGKGLIIGTWQWGGEFFRGRHEYPAGTCRICGRVRTSQDNESDPCELFHGGLTHASDAHRQGALEQADCNGIVSAALQNGVTCFDTAADYGEGFAERMLGKLLASRRSDSWVFANAESYSQVRAVVGLVSAREVLPKPSVVFSKVLLESRSADYEYSPRFFDAIERKYQTLHGEEMLRNRVGFIVAGGVCFSVNRKGEQKGKFVLKVEHDPNTADLEFARQVLCSDHRLCGGLSCVSIHSFDQAQSMARSSHWWEWLKFLRDDLHLFKFYGAAAKSAADCEHAMEWGLLDFISVPFNVLVAQELLPVLRRLRERRPSTVVLARETLASGFLTGHYEDRTAWLKARCPEGSNEIPVSELEAVYTSFEAWKPVACRFSRLVKDRSLPFGSAGAMFALGSGLFDGVAVGFSSLHQARETLDRWDKDSDKAAEFHDAAMAELNEK